MAKTAHGERKSSRADGDDGTPAMGAPQALHGLLLSGPLEGSAPVSPPPEGWETIELQKATVPGLDPGTPAGELIAVLQHREDPARPFMTAVRDDDGYLLRVHGICDLRIDPTLRRMTTVSDEDSDDGLHAVFASGAAFALLLALRGEPTLHASAVAASELGDRVIGVLGAAGVGKTTIAGLLCAAGCSFVSDDVLRVGLGDDKVLAVGGSAELRLRPNAAHLLALLSAAPTRATADGRIAVRLRDTAPTQERLAVIVLPRPRRDIDRLALSRVPPAQALLVLSAHPRLGGVRARALQTLQFEMLSRVAAQVPVVVADVPWNPAPTPETASQLLGEIGRFC